MPKAFGWSRMDLRKAWAILPEDVERGFRAAYLKDGGAGGARKGRGASR